MSVRDVLYVGECGLVTTLILGSLAVGVWASWWGALGMWIAFVLGGVMEALVVVRTDAERSSPDPSRGAPGETDSGGDIRRPNGGETE